MKYQVSQEYVFPYAHRILGYPGLCGRLHGHNARLLVTVGSETLDPFGFVIDFATLHKAIADAAYAFNHGVLLAADDRTLIDALRSAEQAVVELDRPPSAEVIAEVLAKDIARRLAVTLSPPARSCRVLRVACEEEPGCSAVYHCEAS